MRDDQSSPPAAGGQSSNTRSSTRSIVSGMIISWFLFAVYWFYGGGGHAVAKGWNAVTLSDSLLYRQLLPNMLIVAFIGGVTVGLIEGAGRLRRPGVRAACGTLIFLLSSYPLFRASCEEYAAVAEAPALAIFLVVSCLLYMPPAAIGATAGASAAIHSSRRIRATAALCVFLAALLLVNNFFVRRATRVYEESIHTIRQDVSRNLAKPSLPHMVWTPQFGGILRPALRGAYCGYYLFGPRLKLRISSDGKLLSARFVVLGSSDMELAEAKELLRDEYGVSEQILTRLNGSRYTWRSQHGMYSLILTD